MKIQMLYISILIGLILFLSGCNSGQITQLENEKITLQNEVNTLTTEKNELENSVSEISQSKVEEKGELINFFTEFSIAVKNIDAAYVDILFSQINYGSAVDYIDTGEYISYDAVALLDTSTTQLRDGKQLLEKARAKLTGVRNMSPNELYEDSIDLYLSFTEVLLSVTESYTERDELLTESLNELNINDDQAASNRAYDKLGDNIDKYNEDIFPKLVDHLDKIDLLWDQDWYE